MISINEIILAQTISFYRLNNNLFINDDFIGIHVD